MIRFILVCAAVVLMIPTDAKQQAMLRERVVAAAQWTFTYCDRNAQACKTAGELWARAIANAQFAAGMIGEVVNKHMAAAPGGAAPTAAAPAAAERIAPRPASGTLRPDDLRPSWRTGATRTGA